MISDYAREIGETVDRLARLVPDKGKRSQRLEQLPAEDRRYIGDKMRAAGKAIGRLQHADRGERLADWVQGVRR